MKQKSLIARTILAAGMVIVMAGSLDAAIAAPPPGGTPTARILMVDLRRVMGASKVGQDIQRQVQQLKDQASAELNGEAKALKGDETELQQQSAILAADVKARKIKDFQGKYTSFQKKVQDRSKLIQGGVMAAQQQVEQALGPILQGLMKERGATILVDRTAVLLAPNALDVTQLVIQRLDMKMPTVKVYLKAPPAGAEPQQQ